MKRFYILISLPLLWSCANLDYDISNGIDNEFTLFSEEISVPIADIGPLSPKQLLGDTDLGSALGGLFKEDGDGYLVAEKEETICSNPVYLLYLGSLDPTKPMDANIDDFNGNPGASTEGPAGIGLIPAIQDFSLFATNPLTEGMSVSGKLTLSTLPTEVFDKVPVDAGAKDFELFHKTFDSQNIIDAFSLVNMVLHLPASLLEKDPLSGFSSIELGYRYKAQLALGSDFPNTIPIPINDVDLPIGQYRVKDVLLSTEVSNEIPVTLVLESVDVMVKETDDEGNEKTVVSNNVIITPGLTVASGCSGAPVVSPLAIRIKAKEGTLPDIAGLQLNLFVKTPTGEGDKRLNMNQSIRFNNLRATVSGGITFQGL